MKKEIIFWDNDGVLVETEHWFYQANQQALAEMGIQLDLERYMLIMRKGGSAFDLAEEAGHTAETISYYRKKRSEYYRDYLLTRNLEIPGVAETVPVLACTHKMAIITTSRREDFNTIHGNRPIRGYMDFCLTLEDYARPKPYPDPYLKGLQLFNARPVQAVVIEDSERGLRSAQAAGIDCIIVRNEFTRSHDFTGAALIVDSIRDLIRVFQ